MAKKSTFRLQPVLNVKATLVEQLELALAASEKAFQQAVNKLAHLQQLKEQSQLMFRQHQQGLLDQPAIQRHLSYLQHLETYLVEQTRQVALAQEEVEQRRADLVKMMQEKQTLETLREDHFLEERKAMRYKEAKTIDDLVTTRYRFGG